MTTFGWVSYLESNMDDFGTSGNLTLPSKEEETSWFPLFALLGKVYNLTETGDSLEIFLWCEIFFKCDEKYANIEPLAVWHSSKCGYRGYRGYRG